jgi:hypothetical protein
VTTRVRHLGLCVTFVLGACGRVPLDLPAGENPAGENDVVVVAPRTVFVASGPYIGGELGGLTGADATCQSLAEDAGLKGTYRAWLSDSASSPSTRFTKDGGPFMLVDGTVVADDWAALTSGALMHAINRDEVGGAPLAGNATCAGAAVTVVWTDTNTDGTRTSLVETCGDWQNVGINGAAWGVATRGDGAWTDACGGYEPLMLMGTPRCSMSGALYCFQQ